MTEQLDRTPTYSGESRRPQKMTKGEGWGTFASILFLCAALFNGLWGITAIADDDYFRVDELLFGDLTTWGIVFLAIAAAQFATAALILRGASAGAYLGVTLAVIHATVALFSFGAYPLWTACVLVLDGLIIYGLTVHTIGGD